jgi:hypothetical protein
MNFPSKDGRVREAGALHLQEGLFGAGEAAGHAQVEVREYEDTN